MTVTCAACTTAFDAADAVRFRKDGFDIVRCPTCGLLFRARMPNARELAEIYDESYFSSAAGDTRGQGYADYLAEEELHRETARRRLASLERYVPPGALLDVGAAAGFFVDEALKRGWTARGIDIAPAMVEWGCNNLHVALDRTALIDAVLEPASLDAVTMWDYIEHAVDPFADIARTAIALRPGGILALSTGDVASPVARLSGSRWHLLTPRHHNYFFSSSTLSRLLERAGFEVLSATHPGARYSLRYLTYKLRTLADVAALRTAARAVDGSRLGNLKVPVNLADIVTVHARRR